MPAPRFFCPCPLQPQCLIELPATAAHHALRALRLSDGDTVTLFDGTGGQYPATLHISGYRVQAQTGSFEPVECELRGTLRLIQGIASGDKMDWVVEKAVELGVSEIYPVAADRSVLKLSGPRLEKRLAHWRAVVCAASEQCGRNRLLQIHEPTSLVRCLHALSGPTLFCHPTGELDLAAALNPTGGTLNLAIGPEGGWSTEELTQAQRQNLIPIRFGARILRTETAGVALVAAAAALLGW